MDTLTNELLIWTLLLLFALIFEGFATFNPTGARWTWQKIAIRAPVLMAAITLLVWDHLPPDLILRYIILPFILISAPRIALIIIKSNEDSRLADALTRDAEEVLHNGR